MGSKFISAANLVKKEECKSRIFLDVRFMGQNQIEMEKNTKDMNNCLRKGFGHGYPSESTHSLLVNQHSREITRFSNLLTPH